MGPPHPLADRHASSKPNPVPLLRTRLKTNRLQQSRKSSSSFFQTRGHCARGAAKGQFERPDSAVKAINQVLNRSHRICQSSFVRSGSRTHLHRGSPRDSFRTPQQAAVCNGGSYLLSTCNHANCFAGHSFVYSCIRCEPGVLPSICAT